MRKFLYCLFSGFISFSVVAQQQSIGTEIVQSTIDNYYRVPKLPNISNHFKLYFTSSQFIKNFKDHKWGPYISVIADGKIIELKSFSDNAVKDFQSSINRSTALDPTLLLAIGALGAQIKEILEKAQAAGQILEVEAANQIATVIEQTRQAFRSELNLTLDRISEKASETLNSLKTIISDFEKGVYEHIRDLERRALEISHNLPLSKHFPQINKWSPSYTYRNSQLYLKESRHWSRNLKVISKTSDGRSLPSGELDQSEELIHFEIEGDFYDLPNRKFDATVQILNNGQTIKNSTKSSLDIGFDIPKASLTFSDNDIKYNYLKVTVPYKKNVFLFFKKKQIAEFNLPIIALPKAVGKLEIQTTVKQPDLLVQSFSAGPYAQISDDDDIKCGGEHADLAIHCVSPEPGWRIRPSTVSYRMIRSEGDWYACGPDHSGVANACYSFSTIHHGFGTSGKIWFYITYNAEKDVLVDQIENHDIPINWEESKVFTLPDNAFWKGKFTQFDGKVFEFTGPYENAYIKVSQDFKNIMIKIKP